MPRATALRRCVAAAALASAAGLAASSSARAGAASLSAAPVVDLRSDTVTQPTASMRAAMAAAEVGDDVFGDDPTVRRLEARVAELFGKEAALFVPSGTMGNLISIMTHCWDRGSEFVVGARPRGRFRRRYPSGSPSSARGRARTFPPSSARGRATLCGRLGASTRPRAGNKAHVHVFEQGGTAQFGGAHPRALSTSDDGTIGDAATVAAAIRTDNEHFPVTRCVALESTHNLCGGAVLPLAYCEDVCGAARNAGVATHLDGARVWHAAAALETSLADYAAPFDSLSVCLSEAARSSNLSPKSRARSLRASRSFDAGPRRSARPSARSSSATRSSAARAGGSGRGWAGRCGRSARPRGTTRASGPAAAPRPLRRGLAATDARTATASGRALSPNLAAGGRPRGGGPRGARRSTFSPRGDSADESRRRRGCDVAISW